MDWTNDAAVVIFINYMHRYMCEASVSDELWEAQLAVWRDIMVANGVPDVPSLERMDDWFFAVPDGDEDFVDWSDVSDGWEAVQEMAEALAGCGIPSSTFDSLVAVWEAALAGGGATARDLENMSLVVTPELRRLVCLE